VIAYASVLNSPYSEDMPKACHTKPSKPEAVDKIVTIGLL
jgi:hypothetical protein